MSNDKHNILAWASGNERAYADEFIATANILNEHEVYEAMGMYLAMVTTGLRSQYRIATSRPIVHIDSGSGPGHTLIEMANKLDKLGHEKYVLIGVDNNTYMCRHAVNKVLALNRPVTHHICDTRNVVEIDGKLTVQKTYPVHQTEIDSMDFSPNRRIVIIQDDIRSAKVLDAILAQIKTSQGIDHVDGFSFAQPGFSGDAVMGGHTLDLVKKARANDSVRMQLAADYSNSVIDAISEKALQLLGHGGHYTIINRFVSGDGLRKLCRDFLQRDLPENETESLPTRLYLGMLALREYMHKFHPKMGSVLMPRYHELQAKTPIEYASFSPFGGEAKKSTNDQEYDLLAVTTMRSDLHQIGNSGSTITISTKP